MARLLLTSEAAQEAAATRATGRRNLALRLASISVLFLVWEIAGLFTPRIFLAPFHETVIAVYRLTRDGTLVVATLNSLWVLIAGLAISIVLGVVLGLVMGRYRRVAWITEPYVNGLYATPTIAFLPVLVLWLGLFSGPKIALVVLLAIFPIIKNTHAGVATVGPELLEPAVSMRASELQIFYLVIAPSTVPFIMAGIRLAVGRGVVGLVVGEFFTSQSGLGGLLVRYASSFRTAEMFVPIIVLVAVGYGLTSLVVMLQKRLAPWKETERDQGL
jgi:ABC-type nitrate/sulfonate/bicarbonate transport system permease component